MLASKLMQLTSTVNVESQQLGAARTMWQTQSQSEPKHLQALNTVVNVADSISESVQPGHNGQGSSASANSSEAETGAVSVVGYCFRGVSELEDHVRCRQCSCSALMHL